jgi:hypothetical protein
MAIRVENNVGHLQLAEIVDEKTKTIKKIVHCIRLVFQQVSQHGGSLTFGMIYRL